MSSNTRLLHTATWDYFTSSLPYCFTRSPEAVKEGIMTDINDLVQEFCRSSSDIGGSFFAMRRLLEILQQILEVCYSCFSDCVDLADKILQKLKKTYFLNYFAQPALDETLRFIAKFKILLNGYRKMFDQSLSKSKDLGDLLRFLPGVVVQQPMSMQEMADLYGINPDLLERLMTLINFFFEPLEPSSSHYILDDYLSSFLQDRDRSKHYYCDPMLQHISICRHFFSLLDGSSAFDLQS